MSRRTLRYDELSTFMKATYLIVAGSAMPNRTTVTTATTRPTTRRPMGGSAPEMRSNRISSLSFSQKAEPTSVLYGHVTTESSDVQPIGKLKKYRKTI